MMREERRWEKLPSDPLLDSRKYFHLFEGKPFFLENHFGSLMEPNARK